MTEEQIAARKLYMKEYKKIYRQENRERIAASAAAHYLKNRETILQHAKENGEHRRSYYAVWSAINSDRRKDYRKINAKRIAEKKAQHYRENPEKYRRTRTKVKEYDEDGKAINSRRVSEWYKKNPHKRNLIVSRYRASKLHATPLWADSFVISEAYELAQMRSKATRVLHHVDHIVPLQSPNVCGLHCEFNLRVIPGAENTAKGNRHWPDMI
jgi:hypothetical protein